MSKIISPNFEIFSRLTNFKYVTAPTATPQELALPEITYVSPAIQALAAPTSGTRVLTLSATATADRGLLTSYTELGGLAFMDEADLDLTDYMPIAGGTFTGPVTFTPDPALADGVPGVIINTPVVINSNLQVEGTLITVNKETLDVSNAYVEMNTGYTGAMAGINSGIVINLNETGASTNEAFFAGFDGTTQTFRIGLGEYDTTTRGFLDTDTQAVLTRPDTLTDNVLLQWNDTTKSVEESVLVGGTNLAFSGSYTVPTSTATTGLVALVYNPTTRVIEQKVLNDVVLNGADLSSLQTQLNEKLDGLTSATPEAGEVSLLGTRTETETPADSGIFVNTQAIKNIKVSNETGGVPHDVTLTLTSDDTSVTISANTVAVSSSYENIYDSAALTTANGTITIAGATHGLEGVSEVITYAKETAAARWERVYADYTVVATGVATATDSVIITYEPSALSATSEMRVILKS